MEFLALYFIALLVVVCLLIRLMILVKKRVSNSITRVFLIYIIITALIRILAFFLGYRPAPPPPVIRTGEFTYRFVIEIDDSIYVRTDTFATEYVKGIGAFLLSGPPFRVWDTVYASGRRTFSYTILDTPEVWIRFSPPSPRYLMGEPVGMQNVLEPIILINYRDKNLPPPFNLPTIQISMEDAPEILLSHGIIVKEWYVSPRINNTFSRFRRQQRS